MASIFENVFGGQTRQNYGYGYGYADGYKVYVDEYRVAAERALQPYYEKQMQAQSQMNAAEFCNYADLMQNIIEKAQLKKKQSSYREELQEEINEWLR